MKILFIIRSDVGLGNHIQSQAMAISRMGHELYVLCARIGKIERTKEQCPEITWIDAMTSNIFGFAKKIRALVLKIKPDIIYVHSSWTNPSVLLSGSLLAGVPYIYHTDDYLEPKSYKIYKLLEKRFCQKAVFVVSNEINRARFMCSEYALNKMPIIVPAALSKSMAPSEDGFRNFKKQEKETVDLVCTGGMGADRLIHKMILSLGNLPSYFRLFLHGRCVNAEYEKKCKLAVEEAAVQDRVIFHSPIPNEDLLQELMKYDVGLLLYNDNTLGNFYCQPQKLSEYLACGMPIVAPYYPGMELLVHKFGIGAVCDPRSPKSIAQAIISVAVRDENERQEQFLHMRKIFFENIAYENEIEPLKKAFAKIDDGSP